MTVMAGAITANQTGETMADSQGVTLLTLTPTRFRRFKQYILLRWVLRYPSFTAATRRFRGRSERGAGPSILLEALNFIHFGRWILLQKHPIWGWGSSGLPHFEGQPVERRGHGFMMFTSNFDDGWQPYVDTFMEATSNGLGVFWDQTPGWKPPNDAGFEGFFTFVDTHKIDHTHYYTAFPKLATADIKSALAVDRKVRSFATHTKGMDGSDWSRSFDLLVSNLQRSLGSIDNAPSAGSVPTRFVTGGGDPFGLTSLAPFPVDKAQELTRKICQATKEDPSPFSLVGGTHFARLTVISEVRDGHKMRPLESGYVLMSVDADGTVDDRNAWLGELFDVWSAIHPTGTSESLIDLVWGSCYGFDSHASKSDFLRYMAKTSFKPTVPFADYPNTSLWDIHRALHTHRWFSEFTFARVDDSVKNGQGKFEDLLAESIPVEVPAKRDTPDPGNIQANILRGSSTWKSACYVFIRIETEQGASELMKELLASDHVGSARSVSRERASDGNIITPSVNINVAFTHAGLGVIGKEISDGSRYERTFLMRQQQPDPSEDDDPQPGTAFEEGMHSARINDKWPNYTSDGYEWSPGVPAKAWWADDTEDKSWKHIKLWPHMLVWISATDDTKRDDVLKKVKGWITGTRGVDEIGCQMATGLNRYKEHFGFVDGVSQPAIEGFRPGKPGDGKISARGWQGLPVGEFILGYPDEGLGTAERFDVAPFARDGTFLVYRKLRQDVAAFRQASKDMAEDSELTGKEAQESMMGRHDNGAPLVVPPGSPNPLDKASWNDFTYANDPDGNGCPLSSHVRRANPRDDLHFEGRRVNRHRIIRRGMPYGKAFNAEDPDDGPRGLIFIAFNARIEDQFEFIQEQWLNCGRTFRLGDDADPIAGNGENIRIVINGETPVLHTEAKPFTKFLGGDYFFVPSISALNEISGRRSPAGQPVTQPHGHR